MKFGSNSLKGDIAVLEYAYENRHRTLRKVRYFHAGLGHSRSVSINESKGKVRRSSLKKFETAKIPVDFESPMSRTAGKVNAKALNEEGEISNSKKSY